MLDYTDTGSVYCRRSETVRLYSRNGSSRQASRAVAKLKTVSPKRKPGYTTEPEAKQRIESSDDIYKVL